MEKNVTVGIGAAGFIGLVYPLDGGAAVTGGWGTESGPRIMYDGPPLIDAGGPDGGGIFAAGREGAIYAGGPCAGGGA